MCSCEPGWTCPACKGTPFDDRYHEDAHEDAHEPPSWDDLVAESTVEAPTVEKWV